MSAANRTPAERERLVEILDQRLPPMRPSLVAGALADALLAAGVTLPPLPPDPAEQARREAEEDRRTVESWRGPLRDGYVLTVVALGIADRMAARAEGARQERERMRGLREFVAEVAPMLDATCQGSMCCLNGCMADKARALLAAITQVSEANTEGDDHA